MPKKKNQRKKQKKPAAKKESIQQMQKKKKKKILNTIQIEQSKNKRTTFLFRQVKTKKKQFVATPETLDIQRFGVVFCNTYNFYKEQIYCTNDATLEQILQSEKQQN